MRNLIYILLLACSLANAQHGPLRFFNPAVEDYAAQCSTKPDLKVQVAINKFTGYLISTGDWALADRCFVFAQDLQANSNISVAKPTSTAATAVNSPTWTAYQGYTGNGSSSYVNLNFNLSTDPVNMVRNSNSWGYYCRNVINANVYDLGCWDGTNTLLLTPDNGGNANAWANSNVSSQIMVLASTGSGLFMISRTGASTCNMTQNGAGTVSAGGSVASTAFPNLSVGVGHTLGNGSFFTARQIAFTIWGGAINQTNLYKAQEEMRALLGY